MSHNLIDLFCGAGGFSYGFYKKGYNVLLGVDNDRYCVETFLKNHKTSKGIIEDIKKIKKEDITNILLDQKIDLIIGGPPCQGFSAAGKRDPKDPRNSLFKEFVRLVNEFQPKWFIMENVSGLVSMKTEKKEKVIDIILTEFKKIGYNVDYKIIDAVNFGVPQFRKRVFIIGNNLNKKIIFPEPTQTEYAKDSKKKLKTVRETISDLVELKSGEKSNDPLHFAFNHPERHLKWMENVPEGKSAHENKDPSLRPKSGYKTTYKRIWWDRPSPTITTCIGHISSQNKVHPSQNRALTLRESARLQTFPDEYFFAGKITNIKKQIGNAVPPKLSEVFAEHLLKIW
ncbi:MAG: DNA cytosine methyltransferase [Candidatus Woesearchaeota archaeon]